MRVGLTPYYSFLQNRETDILDEVLSIVSNAPRLSPPSAPDAQAKPTKGRATLSKRLRESRSGSSWLSIALLALLQAGLVGLYVYTVRWRRREKATKTS